VSFGRDGCHGFQVNLAVILGSAVDTWATVAVAIGTIGAVAYALFRDLVVTPRRRPKLELRFDRGGNDQVIVATEEGSEAAYARVRVANRGGRDTADDVVVMVTELRRLENSETRPIGLPLAWSGSRPPLTVADGRPGSPRGRRVRDLGRGSGKERGRDLLCRPGQLGRQVVRDVCGVGPPARRPAAEGSVSFVRDAFATICR
jgi:hypothetical protein